MKTLTANTARLTLRRITFAQKGESKVIVEPDQAFFDRHGVIWKLSLRLDGVMVTLERLYREPNKPRVLDIVIELGKQYMVPMAVEKGINIVSEQIDTQLSSMIEEATDGDVVLKGKLQPYVETIIKDQGEEAAIKFLKSLLDKLKQPQNSGKARWGYYKLITETGENPKIGELVIRNKKLRVPASFIMQPRPKQSYYDKTQERVTGLSSNRIGGIVGALLGATIGVALHQANVSLKLLTSSTTLISIALLFIMAFVLGSIIGTLSSTYDILRETKMLEAVKRKGKIPFLSRFTYVFWAMVFGGILGFALTGVTVALSSSARIDALHGNSWYTLPSIILGYVLLGAVSGLGLALWMLVRQNRILDQADLLLQDLDGVVDHAINFQQISQMLLRRLLQIEKLFILRVTEDADSEETETLISTRNDGRNVIFSLLGLGAAGGLIVGGVLCYPTLWFTQLIGQYGTYMLYPGLTLGVIVALLVSLPAMWPEQVRKLADPHTAANVRFQGTIFFITGGIISAFIAVLIATSFHRPFMLLQSAFTHGLIGFAIGFAVLGLAERNIRTLNSSRTKNNARRLGQVAGGVLGIALLVGLCAVVASFAGSFTSNQVSVDVSSTQGWQDTNFYVNSGQTVMIKYLSGTWTVTNGVSMPTDANGKPANPPSFLYCYCGEPLPGVSTQALIGKIGTNGAIFLVGDLKTLRAKTSGDLYLRMNDSDANLSDNAGDLTIQLAIEQPTVTPAPATATPRPRADRHD